MDEDDEDAEINSAKARKKKNTVKKPAFMLAP
jgi:hypothetical protein